MARLGDAADADRPDLPDDRGHLRHDAVGLGDLRLDLHLGQIDDLGDGLEAGADAVLAASIFHFGQHTIGEAKAFLAGRASQRPYSRPATPAIRLDIDREKAKKLGVPINDVKLNGVEIRSNHPSGGFFGMESTAMLKASLDEYVKQGGTLIVFAQPRGYHYEAVPTPDGSQAGQRRASHRRSKRRTRKC